MVVKKKTKSSASETKPAPKTKKVDAASRKPAAKSKTAGVKTAKSAAESPVPAKKRVTQTKKAPAKAKAPTAKVKKRTARVEQEAAYQIGEPVLDPIGDVSSGEGHTYLGGVEDSTHAKTKVARVKTAALEFGPGLKAAAKASQAEDADQASAVTEAAEEKEEAEADTKPLPPPRLERLQKILSRAGIASRRHAEEMIVAGRVMVNGQVVTTLGSKADLGRDHIRVDGKLLHGAERHRYFMLNKPRGYVTTVSDPEHRPTVMEFFANSRERVYPVGRLDYLSEGLLLMTNDGELANLLSKAGSGVEKTYLVNVAGQPSAEELERLRGGVTIEKGEPGSARVRTAPARVREFREGDNPWFEVVLIEGRNRELRKMFAAIGHFAEKIRRVGYGPLVLDVEPGKLRELAENEVNALRLTAEGKMKPRRAKVEKMLPKEAGLAAEKRDQPRDRKFDRPPGRPGRPVRRDDRRPQSPGARTEKPRWKQEERGPKREWQPRSEEPRGEPKPRPEFRPAPRQDRGENRFGSAPRAPFKPRGERPQFRPAPRQEGGENRFDKTQRGPFKPRGERPQFRPAPRPERGENRFGNAPRAPFKPRGERPQWKRNDEAKPRLEVERITGSQKDASLGGGKPKSFFGSKPGGFGKFRGKGGGGAKRGFSRPGAQRGGWSRGSTRKPQS
jgi:23S rRNA pseudouridine2605 synthase